MTEDNIRDFTGNWTGTGTISGTGDAEAAELQSGEYLESEIVNTGVVFVLLAINQYQAGDTVTIKYRTAAVKNDVTGEAWQSYTDPFESLGYVQARLEVA